MKNYENSINYQEGYAYGLGGMQSDSGSIVEKHSKAIKLFVEAKEGTNNFLYRLGVVNGIKKYMLVHKKARMINGSFVVLESI